ncbi:pol protein [Cucumis melo var. makuwa]|uniref:Pol protein n=1 Tax=Cucumis melo var. makuwa TaxID=1194695 RepID=A0A5A7URN6_CUCMM|nr:pol protein [Cucumis melo var. makuwa]
MKGVLRFERKGKLSPRFVGPFEILERISPVAYRLALPPSLSKVHDVFHVSMLRKNVPDPSHVVDYEPLEIDENLSYTEQPVEVLAKEVKMSRNREIPLVKILWRNHRVEKATWEREDDMKNPNPHNPAPSSSSSFVYSRSRRHRPSLHPFLFSTRPASIPVSDFVSVSVAIRLATPPTTAVPVLQSGPASHRRDTRISHPTIRSRRSLPPSSSPPPSTLPLSSSRVPDAAQNNRGKLLTSAVDVPHSAVVECWGGDIRVQEFYDKRSRNQLSSAWVDSFGCGLERDFSYISGKGFLTTGPLIEAGNVVVHMGLWFCIGCGVMVSFIYGVVDLTDMCIIRDHLIDMCKGTARGRPTRGKKDV